MGNEDQAGPMPAERRQITCEACEREYMFACIVSDEEEIEGVHCRCPNCGLPGSDQLLAHSYIRLIHKLPAWFYREIDHFRMMVLPGGYFHGGRYKWDSQGVAAKVSSADTLRRWDLKEEK